MGHPQIAAFASLADGGAKPTRSIAGQNTLITRTIHDFAYDPARDEIVAPQFYAQAILTYRGGANGNEAPIRIIQGPDTQITNADKLALDPIHREIFVPLVEDFKIVVFSSDANGNVAPLRVLKGPDTLLVTKATVTPTIAVDPVHDLLVVASKERGLLIFNRTDAGNVKPRAIISGPKSQLTPSIFSPVKMAVYPPRALLLVGVGKGGNYYSPTGDYVGVWSLMDNGDVPPRWTIGGPNGMLHRSGAITIDPKNKSVIVADKYVNGALTYYFPEIF